MNKKVFWLLTIAFVIHSVFGMEEPEQSLQSAAIQSEDVILALSDEITYNLSFVNAHYCKTIMDNLELSEASESQRLIQIPEGQLTTEILQSIDCLISAYICNSDITNAIKSLKLKQQQFTDVLNGLNYLGCEILLKSATDYYAAWCVEHKDTILSDSECSVDDAINQDLHYLIIQKIIEITKLNELLEVPKCIAQRTYTGNVAINDIDFRLQIKDVDFSSLGYLAITTNDIKPITIYDLSTKRELFHKKGCFTFLPQSATIAFQNGLKITEFNVATCVKVNTVDINHIDDDFIDDNFKDFTKILYSPNEQFYALYKNSSLYIYDTRTNALLKKFCSKDIVPYFNFSPDSSHFVYGKRDDNGKHVLMHILDCNNFRLRHCFEVEADDLSGVCFSPDGLCIIVCCNYNGRVIIFDIAEKKKAKFTLFSNRNKPFESANIQFSQDLNKCIVSYADAYGIIDLLTKKIVLKDYDDLLCTLHDNFYFSRDSFNLIKSDFEGNIQKQYSIAMNHDVPCIIQKSSSDGQFFAEVFRHSQYSYWHRSDRSFDELYVWKFCTLENNLKHMTIEQILFLHKLLVEEKKIEIYVCQSTENGCQKHQIDKLSKIYWSMADDIKRELSYFVTVEGVDRCAEVVVDKSAQSSQQSARYGFKSFAQTIVSKKIFSAFAGVGLGTLCGVGLGYAALKKSGLDKTEYAYPVIGLAGALGGMLGFGAYNYLNSLKIAPRN
jgi:WD40 repeat protein